MAFLAPIVGAIFSGGAATTIAAGVGAGLLTNALSGSKSNIPSLGPAPSAPKPGDSLQQAQKDAAARLRTIRSTGGQTIYTSPLGAQVPSQNVALKTLLG